MSRDKKPWRKKQQQFKRFFVAVVLVLIPAMTERWCVIVVTRNAETRTAAAAKLKLRQRQQMLCIPAHIM